MVTAIEIAIHFSHFMFSGKLYQQELLFSLKLTNLRVKTNKIHFLSKQTHHAQYSINSSNTIKVSRNTQCHYIKNFERKGIRILFLKLGNA